MAGPKLVNLRRARKQKARQEKREAVTGATPAVADLRRAKAERKREEAQHENHRLERDD